MIFSFSRLPDDITLLMMLHNVLPIYSQQLCATKKSTVEGHRNGFGIGENPEWIYKAAQADILTNKPLTPTIPTSMLKSTPDYIDSLA